MPQKSSYEILLEETDESYRNILALTQSYNDEVRSERDLNQVMILLVSTHLAMCQGQVKEFCENADNFFPELKYEQNEDMAAVAQDLVEIGQILDNLHDCDDLLKNEATLAFLTFAASFKKQIQKNRRSER